MVESYFLQFGPKEASYQNPQDFLIAPGRMFKHHISDDTLGAELYAVMHKKIE